MLFLNEQVYRGARILNLFSKNCFRLGPLFALLDSSSLPHQSSFWLKKSCLLILQTLLGKHFAMGSLFQSCRYFNHFHLKLIMHGNTLIINRLNHTKEQHGHFFVLFSCKSLIFFKYLFQLLKVT